MMPGGGLFFARDVAGVSLSGLGTYCTVRSARLSSVKKRRPVPPSGGPASCVKMETGISTLVPVLGIAYRRHSGSLGYASVGMRISARAARCARIGRSPVHVDRINRDDESR